MQVFTLSKRDIEQLIDYNEIIDAVEQSFADYSSGKAVMMLTVRYILSPVISMHVITTASKLLQVSMIIRSAVYLPVME